MSGRLRVALTFDVEFNKPSLIARTGSLYSGIHALAEVMDLLRDRGVPATWLIAHDVDPENQIGRLFPKMVDQMSLQGEIGCHFHFHRGRKVRTDEAFQRAGIGAATRYLRSRGYLVDSFRGGNGYVDARTWRILEDLGFRVDSSVVPGLKEVSPEGLVTDHRDRRRSEPYWIGRQGPGGSGHGTLLEVPLSTETLLDIRNPVFSVLLNRVVGINNLVLSDPEFAASRVDAVRADFAAEDAVVVLSAHPYDFLEEGTHAGRKLARLDRFIALIRQRDGASFATLREIGSAWTGASSLLARPLALVNLTTSDLRRLRRGVRRAVATGRGLIGIGPPESA